MNDIVARKQPYLLYLVFHHWDATHFDAILACLVLVGMRTTANNSVHILAPSHSLAPTEAAKPRTHQAAAAAAAAVSKAIAQPLKNRPQALSLEHFNSHHPSWTSSASSSSHGHPHQLPSKTRMDAATSAPACWAQQKESRPSTPCLGIATTTRTGASNMLSAGARSAR